VRSATLALLAVLAATTGCKMSAADAGRDLFSNPSGFSDSSINKMSCATCHDTDATPDPDIVLPGATMYGVAARSSWWGGQAARLIDAVNQCVIYFLLGDELDPESDEARQLDEFLLSITPPDADPTPVPMTIVENIQPIPLGDAGRGAATYARYCQHCHGETHTGKGGLTTFILPDSSSDYDDILPGIPKGLIVTEAIRHGRFFGIGGQMAFFTTELLGDDEIGDLLAFLDLPTQ